MDIEAVKTDETVALRKTIEKLTKENNTLRKQQENFNHNSVETSQMEQLYLTAPIGLGLLDLDLRYLRVNNFLAEIHGYTCDEHIGKHISEIIPEMAELVKPYFRYVSSSGEPLLNVELEGLTGACNNKVHYWLASYYPLKTSAGKICGINTVIQDITERKKSELALVDSRQKISAQLEHTPLAALALDLELRAVDWNLAAEKLFGFKREEAIGTHLTDLIVSEDILEDQVSVVFDKVLNAQGGERNVNENITRDGRRIICEWHNTPLFDKNGKVIGVASIGQDITERRKLTEALIGSEKRFKNLIETIPYAIQEISLQADVKLCNLALADMLGYEKDELIGKSLWSLLITDLEKEQFANYFFNLLDQQSTADTYITRFYKKNSDIIDVKINWNYVRDIHGHVVSLLCAISDITEHKQAEDALILSEKRFKTLANLSPVGFFHTNPKGYLLYVNKRWSEITGLCYEQAEGDKWLSAIHPEDIFKVTKGWADALGGKNKLKAEFRFQRKDGSIAWVIMQAEAIDGDEVSDANESLRGYVGAVIDITKRRENEEQIRQDQLKLAHFSRLHMVGEMVSGISHELNQPLTSIVHYTGGCLERLKMERISPEITQTMNKVVLLAERAGAIIHRLKNFLRKGELTVEKLEVSDIIQDALKLVEHEIFSSNVDVYLHFAEILPKLRVDKIQIEQVLINIVTNAIEAMTGSPKSLKIFTFLRDNFVGIEIRDNGIGFPENLAEKIISPFFTTKQKGMGMGLSISRGIVENHGGKLQIDNLHSGGTVVTILLPVNFIEGGKNE